ILLQCRTPASVVDDDIKKNLRSACMRRVSQLTELVHAGRAFVENDERGIDGQQVLHGVGTAKTSKARVRRRRRVDREQVQDPAAERVDDVRQTFDYIA